MNGKLADYLDGAGVIFGSKAVEFGDGSRRARRDIFAKKDEVENRELLWAWLRLAAEMRHRTNHFNTKHRLASVVRNGILSPTSDKPGGFGSRKGNGVQQSALDAFRQLLEFDIDCHALMLVNDFNRLQVTRFATDERVKDLLRRALGNDDDPVITTPKFMSVLRKAKGIVDHDPGHAPQWARSLGKLDLTALSQAPAGPNQFKIGVLRHLYATDFESWLAKEANTPERIREAVTAVAGDKKRRTLAVLQGEENRVYAVAETAAHMMKVSGAGSFRELATLVMSMSLAEDNTRKSYKPKPEEQSSRSTWVDEFMRDLFVYLFDAYLQSQGLTWLFAVSDLCGDDKPRTIALAELEGRKWSMKVESWNAQFYAWLYLLPVDEVSLLRNQMRRMLILEKKGKSAETEALREIDRLMTLYIAVSSAGFDGTEHLRSAADAGGNRYLLDGADFYRDPKQFEEVYSQDAETNDHSLPGTRRGLRQIARLGHVSALKAIFQKHSVTPDEVQTLQQARKAGNFNDTHKRVELHEKIVKEAKGIKPDIRKLQAMCDEYRALSVTVTRHNFRANGARLTEHARLHQLMMRVVSRLTDFTLIWERDRNYVLLALIYPRLLHPGEATPRLERRGGRIGFVLPSDAGKVLRDAYASLSGDAKKQLAREIALRAEDAEGGFLPLWDDEMGYRLTGYPIHLSLLDDDQRIAFARFFDQTREENPKDVAERQKAPVPPRQKHQLTFRAGKRRIRNDFAHFNVITSEARGVNLTYLMNAVRSLMAYDRKLKNAVSKAVADIVVDEGLDIQWEMRGDRLRKPIVVPRLETNLKAVRRHKELKDPAFVLPLASARYTSMVKALFDFSSGGYRTEITVGGETRKLVRYPVDLRVLIERLGAAMPDDMLNDGFPEIRPQT
jgi:hypothetical protein